MRLTGIAAFKKYLVRVDEITVGEFYSQRYLSPTDMKDVALEYAAAHIVPLKGVKVIRTKNDRKRYGQMIMPHYGKVN